MWRGDDNQAYRNIIRDHPNGPGIDISTGDNALVYNNTIYNNATYGVDVRSGLNHRIVNNILYLNGTANIIVRAPASTTTQSNNHTTNPTFVNEATRDLHLQASSTAIGGALAQPCTEAQASANICPQAVDISADCVGTCDRGRYEFGGSPAAGPVSRFRFEGNVTDAISGLVCTPTSISFNTVNEMEGTQAAEWNDQTDTVNCPTTFLNPNLFTFEFWVRLTNLTSAQFLLGHATTAPNANRFRLRVAATTGVLSLDLGSVPDAGLNIFSLAANTNYHIALVRDPSLWHVYVNGVERASGTVTGMTALAPTYNIGNYHTPTNGTAGLIDDFRSYIPRAPPRKFSPVAMKMRHRPGLPVPMSLNQTTPLM